MYTTSKAVEQPALFILVYTAEIESMSWLDDLRSLKSFRVRFNSKNQLIQLMFLIIMRLMHWCSCNRLKLCVSLKTFAFLQNKHLYIYLYI